MMNANELEGGALDAAVAVAKGFTVEWICEGAVPGTLLT